MQYLSKLRHKPYSKVWISLWYLWEHALYTDNEEKLLLAAKSLTDYSVSHSRNISISTLWFALQLWNSCLAKSKRAKSTHKKVAHLLKRVCAIQFSTTSLCLHLKTTSDYILDSMSMYVREAPLQLVPMIQTKEQFVASTRPDPPPHKDTTSSVHVCHLHNADTRDLLVVTILSLL